MSTAFAERPWYRQPWPWFVISLPLTAVIAGLVTFYLAARGWDGPVTQDYYKQGLAINAEITRAARARELDITAEISLAGLAGGDRVRVELVSVQPLPPEAALRVRLAHPGRRDADRLAVLARIGVAADNRSALYEGTWQGEEDNALSARHAVAWQAIVETPQWRIDEGFSAAGAGNFKLRAR